MSTEHTFRRASVVTIIVLVVLSIGLGAAAVLRGPVLSSASVNLGATVSRDGSRLVLHADQALAALDPGQVALTPDAPFTVTAAGTDITLAFDGMLDYDTDYRVVVRDAEGEGTGISSTLTHDFRTPDVPVYTLLRGGGLGDGSTPLVRDDDRIIRSTLAGGAEATSTVAFQAPRIQQFAVVDGALAVVELGEDGSDSLTLALDGGTPYTVHTPSGGRLQNLRSSASARLFGFTVSGGTDAEGRDYQNALFVLDPLGTSGRAEEVTGFGGESLRVVDWEFVPGTSSLVAQGVDQQLYLIDPLSGGEPTPLGRHAELRGFLPGGAALVVADGETVSQIDLTTGAVSPLAQPAPDVDPALYPKTIVTAADGVVLRQYDEVDYASDVPVTGSRIVVADAAGTRELYTTATPGSRVRDFCLSPNGQYIAVETVGAGALTDGYPLPGYSEVSTSFVDVSTGLSTRSVPGFLPDWCS
ncbi:hypothetical protein N1031_00505 [Herbiconiux moechotypicola]|uniref:SbsA Ig-like domain-containing protein n=1 Tax=Herbiconiux moechotypicola TaxID=637393 RepID=A0ABN3D955_9MICO|nr:hypothetical protein [Herbiconiux moechotypicola]MCS5728231.1 hypothetical protein [Herbiconiux moechotypicola]